jgi:lysyl-tRNA synthetase class 2
MFEFEPDWLTRLEALRAAGTEPYPTGLNVPHTTAELREAYAKAATSEGISEDALHQAGSFCFAGRLMFKNEMGKAGFGRLLDREGRFQIYVKKDEVGEEAFKVWKSLDLGDHVWVQGSLMRTRTGEPTLKASSLKLASKCIHPLPDKWHGLSDPEIRQRQRYLDLFANAEGREIFKKRARIVSMIRSYFDARGYCEVETPMMHPIPGGANAKPFITHHKALNTNLFLRIAPELYLKRLVVGGLERVYEINRNFRNEGIDTTHNPEFTMLEFYEAYATWETLMAMSEELITGIVQELCGSLQISYQGQTLDFQKPWRRASMSSLIAEATGLSEVEVWDAEILKARWLKDHPAKAELPSTTGKWFEWFFDAYVEKKLVNPTFVTDFPVEISPLSRRSEQNPLVAERFELFVAGREIANGFNELNDPVDQAARFMAQVQSRAGGDHEAMHFDGDYIRALCFGLPPTAGEGLGIDRLAMLLTDSASIRDVILFPTLRPQS